MTAMTSSFLQVAAAMVVIFAADPAIVRAQGETGSWLDKARPESWNQSGMSIPRAPARHDANDPKCQSQARSPESAEDKQVREKGWHLEGAYLGGWQMLVIRAAAEYDGMCRPMQYQAFVFVRGVFAGTLAPRPMDSRTDGALYDVFLRQGRLSATYERYTAKDPLCCASGTTTVEFEVGGGAPAIRPVSASTFPNTR